MAFRVISFFLFTFGLTLTAGYNAYRGAFPRDVSYYGPGISVRIGNQMPPHHEPDAVLINVGGNQPGGNPEFYPPGGSGPFGPPGGSGPFGPPGPGVFRPPNGPGVFGPPGGPGGFGPPGGPGGFGPPGGPGMFGPPSNPGGFPGVFGFPNNPGGFGHPGGPNVFSVAGGPGSPNLFGNPGNNGFGGVPGPIQPRAYVPRDENNPNAFLPGFFVPGNAGGIVPQGFIPQGGGIPFGSGPPPGGLSPRPDGQNGGREIYDDPITAEQFPLIDKTRYID